MKQYNEPSPHVMGLLKRHIISTSASVRDALESINALSGESMTLFAVAPSGKVAGTVTDGDIRRAIISGASLGDRVEKVMHTGFLAATPGTDLCLAVAEGRRRGVCLLPVVEDGYITDILDLRTLKTVLPIEAVLMAGGRGERLRPLTDKTPKPLLRVGGKAVIDYNVDELEACGVRRIFVTVNYLAEQIEAHFAGRAGRCRVACVREPRRLGTMGSVALVDGLQCDDILMMNSDLLTTLDFEAMYLHHRRAGNDFTIAAVPYTVSVPFAIMRMEGDKVRGLEEKPTYNYFANGGVYIFKRSLIGMVTKGEYLDAPDFISALISRGGKVGCYPIDGTWVDIGSPDDFRYANELMRGRAGK